MIILKIANIKKLPTKAKIENIANDENLSKSAKIRTLFTLGIEVKEIANILNIRYNFVYNVVSNHIIQNEVEVEMSTKVTKKSLVIEMFNQGKSTKEIAIDLKTNYNYVHSIIKELKQSLEG